MKPVTVSVTVARPREEVFEYLADIANHAEFTDHFLVDWHLTREDSYGKGAGVRFRIKAPGNRFSWGEATFVEVEPPARIVEAGRGGKFNRVRFLTQYVLSPVEGDKTKVELTTQTEPVMLSDRLMEALGARTFIKAKYRKALKRLRAVLEEGERRGRRVTVAGR